MENLFLVTFEIDLTQFLCNAKDEKEAVEMAHEVNMVVGEIDEYDFKKLNADDYSVERVDFNLLAEMFKRDDYWGHVGNVVVFND